MKKLFATAAVQAAISERKDESVYFTQLLEQRYRDAIFKLNVSKKTALFLDQVVCCGGRSSQLALSNMEAMRVSNDAAVRIILDKAANDSDITLYLGTFSWDAGIVPLAADDVAVKPMVDKVYRALWRRGLQGLIFPDIDIVTPIQGSPDWWAFVHLHAIVYMRGVPLRPKKLAASMMNRNAFPNPYIDGVSFDREVDQNPTSIAGLAYYTAKTTACVKRWRPNLRSSGKPGLERNFEKLGGRYAIRMMEMRSRLHLYDVVRSVGEEGVALRALWKSALSDWERQQENELFELSSQQIKAGWKRFYREQPQLGFHPSGIG